MLRSFIPVKRTFSLLLVLFCATAASLATAAPAAPDATGSFLPLIFHSGGWVTLLSENFEGSFPDRWQVYDGYPGSGDYHWGKRSCRGYGGGASAWSVGGGGDGASLPCGHNYPGNAVSWLIYGPFSLADATRAELSLMLWTDLAPDAGDYLFIGASADGSSFHGQSTGGNTGGWVERTLDLANIITLGSLMGQPEVWVAFVFSSDAGGTRPEGAYIDDVLLRKYVGP